MSRLRENLVYNLVNQLLTVSFPVFLNIYLVRVLHLEDLGTWYFVNAVAALVQLLMTAPHFWLVRKLSSGVCNPRKTISAGIFTYLVVFFGCLPFVFAYICYAAPQTILIAQMVFFNLFMSAVSCEYYFHAFLRQRFLMIRRIVTRLLLAVLLVTLVRNADDFRLFLFLTIGTYILEHMIGLIAVVRQLGLTLPDRDTLLPVLGSLREMLPFNATHNTLPHVALLLSPRIFDLETVAVLSILVRIINMTTTLVSSSAGVVFPYLVSGVGDAAVNRRMMWATGLASVVVGASCFVLHRPLGFLFLNRALVPEEIRGFSFLCAYIVIHTCYNYMAFNYLIIRGKTHIAVVANVIVLLCFVSTHAAYQQTFLRYTITMTVCASIGLVILVFWIGAMKVGSRSARKGARKFS